MRGVSGDLKGHIYAPLRATCIFHMGAHSRTLVTILIIIILLYIIINFIIINAGTEIIASRSVYTPRCSLASYIYIAHI